MARLPLFPLNTVLFPGMTLPLHIFEERYKLMIDRCVEERSPFGVVLIRAGEEVGDAAEPFDIGTTARIARIQRLEDGRMNLIALGDRRYRISQIDRSEPYLSSEVEYLRSEEVDTARSADEARRVSALYQEQRRLALAMSGQWQRFHDLASAPDRLADVIAAGLEAPANVKQELLEELSVRARLRHEAELLGAQIRQLSIQWQALRKERYAGAALN